MGIEIHLAIAKSTTKEEWTTVYEESLKMVKEFPLAEKKTVSIDGIDTICLVRTEECETTYGWKDEKTKVGWSAIGDYESMRTGEDYYLDRNLVVDSEYVETCEDAMFGVLPSYFNYDGEDERFSFIYDAWGMKTQGEPYHIYLLAIACMIESRLGNKAFIYGDITKGQCIKAVQLANEVLDEQIDIPARCDTKRLMTRVETLPLTEKEKVRIFEGFYLGKKGAKFGEILREYFSPKACNEYWQDRFSYYNIDQYGFNSVFINYMLWGFDFSEICKYIKFDDKDDTSQYEKFVKHVMDAKLHLKEKDCSDPLEIDQDEARPYSVYTQFAQFFLRGAKNKKIDRYIPITEIKRVLIKELGDKCDVNQIIDKYLQEENEQETADLRSLSAKNEQREADNREPSEILKQIMDTKKEILKKNAEEYDISIIEHLMFYEKGDTLYPGIEKPLVKFFAFYNSVLAEETYKKLMGKTPQERCEFLIEQNTSLLIRDKDWQKIFKDIRDNGESYARYYPMIRVKINNDDTESAIRGIVLNDELYEHCKELLEKYEPKDEE